MTTAEGVVDRRRGTWHPLAAAGMSLIVPGAGQWYAGRRRRAIPFLALGVLAVAAGALLVAQGSIFALQLIVQPRWVWAVIIGNVALGAVRLWAATDAYVVAAPRSGHPSAPVLIAVGAVLAAVLIVPHAIVGSKAAAMLDLLEEVFVSESPTGPRIVPFEPPVAGSPVVDDILPDPEPRPVLPNMPDGVPKPVIPVFVAPPTPVVAPEDIDRITILLAGGDAGPGRGGNRTDTIMIASLDTRTGKAVLITVSRELVGFPVPTRVQSASSVIDRNQHIWNLWLQAEERGSSRATFELPEEPPEEPDADVWLDRINAIYPYTRTVTWAYPGVVSPGLEALKRSLSEALGIRIDYYLMVDMAGFVDVIDAVGGVRVNSRESMHVRFSPEREGAEDIIIEIEPGSHHFDGRTALAYVRNRTGSSDLVRTRRQRCFLRDVAGQFDSSTVVRRFEAISRAVQRHTTTDIPLRFLPTLATAIGGVDRTDVGTLAIDQVSASRERDYRNLPIVDIPRARQLVRDAFDGLNDPDAEVVAEC